MEIDAELERKQREKLFRVAFARQLLKARNDRQVSLARAADACGVAVQSYQAWEAAKTLPEMARLLTLSEFFERPPSWFFDRPFPRDADAGVHAPVLETELLRDMARDLYNREVGARMAQARNEANETRESFAARLHQDIRMIEFWESGLGLQPSVLWDYSNQLGKSISWLMGETEAAIQADTSRALTQAVLELEKIADRLRAVQPLAKAYDPTPISDKGRGSMSRLHCWRAEGVMNHRPLIAPPRPLKSRGPQTARPVPLFA